ncbi:hypothetical protein M9458_010020, partial [Cirrhinus mrigala]
VTKASSDRSAPERLAEAPLSPERSDGFGSQTPSQDSDWHVWSGWWSEEVKGHAGFEEQETDAEHLQAPSESSRSESALQDHKDETQENVLNEETRNMEKDEDKQ